MLLGGSKTETGKFLLHFQNSKSCNRCRSIYGTNIKMWHPKIHFRQICTNSTGLKNTFKTAQKTKVEPHMATYWYYSLPCKFINLNYAWHNGFTTRSNLTGLKKCFKTAQKTNVEPYMATYWFNSVIYMYFITNLTWYHFLQSMIVKCP